MKVQKNRSTRYGQAVKNNPVNSSEKNKIRKQKSPSDYSDGDFDVSVKQRAN